MLLNCGVGEHSWESLGLQGDPPVLPKGNQSWIFIGRTNVEAETPILWPPDMKSWFIWKDPDAGKEWRWEEKGMAEDEMIGCHHWFSVHEFGWTPGFGDGQGGNTTQQLNWKRQMFFLNSLAFSTVQWMLAIWSLIRLPFLNPAITAGSSWFIHCWSLSSVHLLSRVWLFVTPMDCSMPGFPVHHQLPELAQTHVHWVDDAIHPSHPLTSPSPPAFSLSQHQGLSQWFSSLHQVTRMLEFEFQHQSFQ